MLSIVFYMDVFDAEFEVLANVRRVFVDLEVNLTTNHHGGEFARARCRFCLANNFALTNDGDLVRHRLHFAQLVSDEND